MRKIANLFILLFLLAMPALLMAHPGHEHSTIFSEALLHHIVTYSLIAIPFILLAFYLVVRHKRARQRG
jgi:hypothetical protein